MSQQLMLRGVAHAYALKPILEDIDLSLDGGRVLALVGPSGCGKTTLLHLCAGLLTCQTGTLDNGFARPAVMFQQPRLLPWKTTRDNIALGLKAAGLPRAEWQMRAQAMGHTVGLDAVALDQFPHQLSGGMQSRAALARALVLEPDLLLMDEPFSALDIGLKAQLHRLLLYHQAQRGVAVLMITHDLMEAVRLADTVLTMASEPGRIVHRFDLDRPARQRDDGFVHRTTAELLQAPMVRACFGLEALASSVPVDDDAIVGAGGTALVIDIARRVGKKGIAC
jgi:NitT/TauT family transport system ATP-binding protein